MAGGNSSKNKGSGAERELARHFGKLFQGSFIRSNNSGAYIGGKNVHRKDTLSANQTLSLKGDIVPPDFMPKFVIEAKFYAEFRWHQLIHPAGSKMLDGWIRQTLDVIDPHDVWFVCFKINLHGWWVCVPEESAPNYQFKGHAVYHGEHGWFRVAELFTFFDANRDVILRMTA